MSKRDKITVLVGNGLGRALDNDYFTLKKVMQTKWAEMKNKYGHTKGEFFEISKELMDGKQQPKCEDDLFNLHAVFMSLLQVKGAFPKKNNRLNELFFQKEVLYMPELYYEYVHKICKHFFDFVLPEDKEGQFMQFIESFCIFLKCNKNLNKLTNLFTTNYDKLLYKALLSKAIDASTNSGNVMDKFLKRTFFVDGFGYHKDKNKELIFTEEKLFPKYKSHIGIYAHLHGSPLFYSADIVGEAQTTPRHPCKDSSYDFYQNNEVPKNREHIILCHRMQKESQIHFSYLLDIYFDLFYSSIISSKIILIIGYGGTDYHINRVIKKNKMAKIVIVERSKEPGDRTKHWNEALRDPNESYNGEISLINDKDSILEYDFKKGLG